LCSDEELLLVELGHGIEPSIGHFGGWDKDLLVGLWVNDLDELSDGFVDLWSELSGFSSDVSSGVEKVLPVHEVLLLPVESKVSDSWVSEVESTEVLELVPVESEVSDSWVSEVESTKVLELLLVPVGTEASEWSLDVSTFMANVNSTDTWEAARESPAEVLELLLVP
jgi:hypothetical protein